MRVLMMISNRNMGIRESYGLVLREQFPGWGTSNMSGLPVNADAILRSYDLLIFELEPPDDPKRYRTLLDLAALVTPDAEGRPSIRIVTHLEGPYRDGMVTELEAHGVVCVEAPFTAETIAAALHRVAPPPPTPGQPSEATGLGERLRGLFGRRGA